MSAEYSAEYSASTYMQRNFQAHGNDQLERINGDNAQCSCSETVQFPPASLGKIL